MGRLLGGRYRERVLPYASILMQQPEPLVDHLQSIRAQGFRAEEPGIQRSAGIGKEEDGVLWRG